MDITKDEMDELKVLMESIPLKEDKPLEGWINRWGHGSIDHVITLYPTYDLARHAARAVSGEGPTPYARTIKMREVKE